jgi:hypothetical protein
MKTKDLKTLKKQLWALAIAPWFILGSMAFLVSGCSDKTTKNSPTSTNPITGNPPVQPTATVSPTNPTQPSNCPWGNGNEPGVADSGQSLEYYKLNNPPVVAHGAGYGTVIFSTETDLPTAYNQNIFFSDGRFNLRVIPRYQQQGVDSKGRNCAYNPMPFEKMNIGIVVRSRQSSPGVGDYYQFKDVPVNCASKIHQFQVPSTSDPLVIEVMNVEWDYSCIDYANRGYPNHPGVCPYDDVWRTECFAVEVQFSTDTTKDIPGTKTYQ